jgi:hypothetical protein
MSSYHHGDPLGQPATKTKMTLDDALAELGYGSDDWPSLQDVAKRFRTFNRVFVLPFDRIFIGAGSKNCN